MAAKDLEQKWEEYVNSFLFANFKALECWVAKRYATENTDGKLIIYNYIKFPIAENGSVLTEYYLEHIIKVIENSEGEVRENIFGPAYKNGEANIEKIGNDMLITWNVNDYEQLLDKVDDEDRGRWNAMIRYYYAWDVWTGVPKNLSAQEIERRKRIDAELNRMATALSDPKLGTAHRTPKEMEAIYNNYHFKDIDD